MKILIINGPNLNLLGTREPEVYGSETFEQILKGLRDEFPEVDIQYFQSNHEGQLIDRIQAARLEGLAGLVFNGGAFTHYSYALHDALLILEIPKIEVHLSHIFARETFRHKSVTGGACDGMITGLGKSGYRLAIQYLLNR